MTVRVESSESILAVEAFSVYVGHITVFQILYPGVLRIAGLE